MLNFKRARSLTHMGALVSYLISILNAYMYIPFNTKTII